MQKSDRELKQQAVERLLVWGFQPGTIAIELHCRRQWVQTVRRVQAAGELDEGMIAGAADRLLGTLDDQGC